MLRTIVATGIVFVTSCGSKTDDKPGLVGGGPAYTPVVANGLRAIAPDCKTTKTGTAEQLRCTSTKGLVEISLEGNHFVSLSIGLRSMIFGEAKSHLGYALRDVLGGADAQQVLAKFEKMQTGDTASLLSGSATLELSAGGTSKIAPEYQIVVRWAFK